MMLNPQDCVSRLWGGGPKEQGTFLTAMTLTQQEAA